MTPKVWDAALGALIILDIAADKHPGWTTLSTTWRTRIEKVGPVGVVAFTGACIGVPAWFWGHILLPLFEKIDEAQDIW